MPSTLASRKKPKCSQPAPSMLHGFLRLQQNYSDTTVTCPQGDLRPGGWRPCWRTDNTQTDGRTEGEADVSLAPVRSVHTCPGAKHRTYGATFVPKHSNIKITLWNGLVIYTNSYKWNEIYLRNLQSSSGVLIVVKYAWFSSDESVRIATNPSFFLGGGVPN